MLLAASSCFFPLIFLPLSTEALVPRVGVGMREVEGQRNKKEASLSETPLRGDKPHPLLLLSCLTTASWTPSPELSHTPTTLLQKVCQWSTQMVLNPQDSP